MNKSELIIYANNQAYNVDLYDNESITVEKSIIDVMQPEQRKADFTRTIKVGGTTNNNQIFGNIFDVSRVTVGSLTSNFAADFNPSLKANCILYNEGLPIIRGYLQLTNISIIDNYNVEYELIIIGRNANLFQDMGDSRLTDLDLSQYNHAWDETNVINSWSAPVGEGYVYPIIDRGFDPTETTYYINEIYPAVYVKSIVDAIFKKYGYTYNSNFFNSERFKRLIIPFASSQFRMTEAEVNDRLFDIAYSTDTAYFTGGSRQLIDFDTTLFAPPSSINLSKFTVPAGYGGRYIFRTELKCRFRWTGSTLTSGLRFSVAVYITSTSGLNYGTYVSSQFISGTVATNQTLDFNIAFQTPETDTPAGEELFVEFAIISPIFTISVLDMQLMFLQDSAFFNSYPTGLYNEGDTISLSAALPQEMTQAEFMKGLIKMFNLFIEPDNIQDRTLNIEPFVNWYKQDVKDWTHKLDVSSPIELVPMGALDFKEIQFLPQKDDDEFNKKYNEMYEYTYGSRRVKIENDFLTNVRQVELPFAPSPLADSSTNDRTLTKIRYFNDNNVLQAKTAKPRILYYGGLVPTDASTFILRSRLTGLFVAYPDVAYAGHLDDVNNPTFDLNFGLPQTLFYGSGYIPQITNANLYNVYWSRYISEITDRDSKIFKCKMYVTNNDLSQLTFRDVYYIDRQLYRLHKIVKDINSNDLASCEFLKIKSIPDFVPTSKGGNGGIGNIGVEVMPDKVYWNTVQYQQFEFDYGTPIQDYGSTIQLEAKTHTAIVYGDMYLPPPDSAYNFQTNKSVEIGIVNNNGGNIRIYDTSNGTDFNITSNKAHHFVTNGFNWFQI